jgi:hypothetical protein
MNLTRLKTLGLAAVVASSVLVPYAFASGVFQGYPIVGSAAFCNSQNSQSTSSTVPGTIPSGNCTNTVPAGPSSLTGNELWPADTNIANGGGQETVRVPMVLSPSGAYLYNAPLTGASITVPANVNNVILDPAANIAALTLVLPAASSLIDGQLLRVSSSASIATLTITPGTGTTVSQSPTAITTSVTGAYGFSLIYDQAKTKWYRLM